MHVRLRRRRRVLGPPGTRRYVFYDCQRMISAERASHVCFKGHFLSLAIVMIVSWDAMADA